MYQRIGPAAYKKSLTNIKLLCNLLDSPQNKFKSIHIAGTNGKGSVAHLLSAILQTAGYKTGLYTSPHLKEFTERIKINGTEISKEEVIDFVEANKKHFEKINPSFFEMTVAMAFNHFAAQQVDIALIEVGLGGRLDSTNIINPELCIITNISYDHQAMLGQRLQEIAREKAGIIKPDTPVIIGEYQPEVAGIFEKKARALNAPIYFASKNFELKNIQYNVHNLSFDNTQFKTCSDPEYSGEESNPQLLVCDLAGSYQIKNITTVLQTIELLNSKDFKISVLDMKTGLANVSSLTGLKGRWQVLNEAPLTICDTAHNEEGIRLVVEQIKSLNFNNLHFVLGVVNDKEIDGLLKMLPQKAFYYFCQPGIQRALDAEMLADSARKRNLKGKVVKDVNEAITQAVGRAKSDDLVFIGGSSFVIADINDL
ncbi:MAG: bifunctional folylpolyglutamate synthase/dihydrofolate synthase [Cytophagales bacterium]|nr:bifunctional folylpolyglutamate synthase/dihydrofolate synthase [Cytophagales bacterium]